MKDYRLKEEAKRYFSANHHLESCLDFWESENVSLEALEEVEQRVKLEILRNSATGYNSISKVSNHDVTEAERLLCEQALNGELMTLDQCINLYDEWLNTTTDLLLTDWIKQRKA